MRKVVILSGVSGSGKSAKATNLCNKLEPDSCKVVSADDFFMVDNEYKFDASNLGKAHGNCFRDFIKALTSGEGFLPEWNLVIVDNTNTTAIEIAPYMLGAQAWGYEAEIITLMCESDDDLKMCAARNSHGVSLSGVLAQHNRLTQRSLLPWWPHRVIRPIF